jgi:hypothetical protein
MWHYYCYEELARLTYFPSAVETMIFSPISINIGTFTVAPLSNLAGFSAAEAVLPLKFGGVSTTVYTICCGNCTSITCSFHVLTSQLIPA